MTYNKNVWKEDGTTPITAARLNNAETQYDQAVTYVDTKVNPYFGNVFGPTNYGTASNLQQMNIGTAGYLIGGCTLGLNEVFFPLGGIYCFDAEATISGLNAGKNFELILRVYQADGVTYSDTNWIVSGYSGGAGNNNENITNNSHRLVSIPSNGKIRVYIRIGEAPRTINMFGVRIWKISN